MAGSLFWFDTHTRNKELASNILTPCSECCKRVCFVKNFLYPITEHLACMLFKSFIVSLTKKCVVSKLSFFPAMYHCDNCNRNRQSCIWYVSLWQSLYNRVSACSARWGVSESERSDYCDKEDNWEIFKDANSLGLELGYNLDSLVNKHTKSRIVRI